MAGTIFEQRAEDPSALTLTFEDGDSIWLILPDGSEIRLFFYRPGRANRITITADRSIIIERNAVRTRRLIRAAKK